MELKKSAEANLESSRTMYFLSGLVFSLAIVLCSFEWHTPESEDGGIGVVKMDNEEEEMIPITQQEPPPPPPPPPPQQVIEIVEDDEEIEEELEIEDTEIDEDTEIEFVEVAEEVIEEDKIFMVVEEMPTFPGCTGAKNEQQRQECSQREIMKYLGKNVNYPKMAKDAGISGVVYVTFVINKKGKVDNIKLLKGIGGGCDEEAVKVVKNMPQWTPGKQRGKPVSVQYNLPIRYTLK